MSPRELTAAAGLVGIPVVISTLVPWSAITATLQGGTIAGTVSHTGWDVAPVIAGALVVCGVALFVLGTAQNRKGFGVRPTLVLILALLALALCFAGVAFSFEFGHAFVRDHGPHALEFAGRSYANNGGVNLTASSPIWFPVLSGSSVIAVLLTVGAVGRAKTLERKVY